MAVKTTPPVDVKEYGTVKKEAQGAEALAATAAMEAETTPQVEVPPVQAAAQQPAPQQVAPATAAPQGFQPKSLMQLVPPDLLFRTGQSRLPSQQDYDIGQLWRALEQGPNIDPLVRAIAKRLLREAK